MSRTAIVVGAGVGGLAAAIELGRAGVQVRVLERGKKVGGKLAERQVGGRTFLTGPSVFTMRGVFEELFGGAAELAAELLLEPVDPLCRHYFADGSILDLFADEDRSYRAIAAFAGARDADGYRAFRRHAAKIHDVVRGPFMEHALTLSELLRPSTVLKFTQIDGLRTLWRAVESFFVDPRLRQLFARYATYNGSSPFHAPGTLAVIAHVENAYGVFSCPGGIYRLAEALERRARSLGVTFEMEREVAEIVVEGGRAVGVRCDDKIERADVVVANADVAHVYGQLLRGSRTAHKLGEKYGAEELSLSAYTLLAVVDRAPLELAHHNVFFSTDYAREFRELVDQRRPPTEPTVYLCADDRVAGVEAPATERAFFLTNAPPLDEAGRRVDWATETAHCRERIAKMVARHGWTLRYTDAVDQTPVDFAARFPSSQGALYGLASNSKTAAFKRPTNRVSGIARLYLVGGTVHPGAGLPMVCLSAKMAAKMVLEDLDGR